MDTLFEPSERAEGYRQRLLAFMDEHIYPNESVYEEQMRELAAAGNPHATPQILLDLKKKAKAAELWNMFHPTPNGAGTDQPGVRASGRDHRPRAVVAGGVQLQCPDTGNMEVFTLFGTDEHKEKYLKPLLDGEIASAFAMTEPAVASSDATNVELRMERDGDEYVLNGRKWFASNAVRPDCKVLIVMGKTDPTAPTHRQQSMMVVPIDAPGLTILRNLSVFGYVDRESHGELIFDNVRVPSKDVLKGEGEDSRSRRHAWARSYPSLHARHRYGRTRWNCCAGVRCRTTFGAPLADRSNIQDWIAEARIEIEMVRLFTLKAAYMMDTVGNKKAATEIAAIKVAAPNTALKIVDRAIQVFGGMGVTDDVPLATFYAHLRTLRLADGPDEVHKRAIARRSCGRMSRLRPRRCRACPTTCCRPASDETQTGTGNNHDGETR